jgi:beta-glucosidase
MRDIQEIISALTLEEKASLCCGEAFWHTTALPQHGIPGLNVSDGPHGLRIQTDEVDHLGIHESDQTTCFPTAAGLACSWNRGLVKKLGIALGEECQAERTQVILGPGANIKRSPLCGRNFEYFSEDPYLSAQLAANHIQGVQSQGIGTALKHFAVNNQETKRFNINVLVDERALREIYLASFEGAVKDSQPWTVMCAYNKINGEFCSQNRGLLTDILRGDWGFEGFVVSDWFATCERDLALEAGMDLEMPTSAGAGEEKIIAAVRDGRISEETLDKSVERILSITFKAVDGKKENATYSKEEHHKLAKEIARESMVLLKNEKEILPLKKDGKIAVIGFFAKQPRFQGAGSSRINPTQLDIPYDEFKKAADTAVFTYADGYSIDSSDVDEAQVNEAKETAAAADVCVVFVGLPDKMDSEGVDRKHMKLPDSQNVLIEELAKVQKNIVVVLLNGSAVEMPWFKEVNGVLEAYLGGQAMAGAVADILFGDFNPCGKLAETFPVKLSDTPCFINFPGEAKNVEYREGIFVGYRYYDKAGTEPLFPFGYGLSYTSFAYSDLQLSKREMNDTEELKVSLRVTNTGERSGKEIVQLYVRDKESSVLRPDKELKGFEKISLAPGETGLVEFVLDKRSFAFYDVAMGDWRVESGDFEILVGKSSRDILLADSLRITSTVKVPKDYNLDSTIADVKDEPIAAPIVEMMSGSLQAGQELGMDLEALFSSIKLRSLVAMGKAGGGPPITEQNVQDMIDAMNG